MSYIDDRECAFLSKMKSNYDSVIWRVIFIIFIGIIIHSVALAAENEDALEVDGFDDMTVYVGRHQNYYFNFRGTTKRIVSLVLDDPYETEEEYKISSFWYAESDWGVRKDHWNIANVTISPKNPGSRVVRVIVNFEDGTTGIKTMKLTVVKRENEDGSFIYTYNANGGTGTPSSQKFIPNTTNKPSLSNEIPKKNYVINYNANGGSVSPASKSVDCDFVEWNTLKSGNGFSYKPGDIIFATHYYDKVDWVLYAQWTDPKAGDLAIPVRNGHSFLGWYTSPIGGTEINSSTVITDNTTAYAHWTNNDYNLGDETYSFENYADTDFPGHCFGMSMTSSGYYNNWLDIRRIGGDASTSLFKLPKSSIVNQPICYYQGIQGSYARKAIVAGGSFYLNQGYNIASDWRAVINYVKNHNYDNKGVLQVGYRKNKEGGHAVNFLRYENVNGQDRIYVYDNNFPNKETYFYNSNGKILQAPVQTFSGPIDCIVLRDAKTYFKNVSKFDATHVLYMAKEAATVQGYTYTSMEGGESDEEYVMYEIPADKKRVTIIPNKDYADFIYMDTEYSFGKISDETRGELKFSTMDEHGVGDDAKFTIYEGNMDSDAAKYEYSEKTVTVNNGLYALSGSDVIFIDVKKNNIAKLKIPATVKIDGKTRKVTKIAPNAFKNCNKLTTVVIGKNVKYIGDGAFSDCKNLTKVTIGTGVKLIGEGAFQNCQKLKTVSGGKNLATIGTSAFSGCRGLTKFTLNSKVKSVGKNAFLNCKKLKTITIKTSKLTAKTVGANAFKGIYAKATIKVPKTKLKAYTKLLKKKGIGKNVKVKK